MYNHYNVGLLKRIHLFKNPLMSDHYVANILLVRETQTALRQIPYSQGACHLVEDAEM